MNKRVLSLFVVLSVVLTMFVLPVQAASPGVKTLNPKNITESSVVMEGAVISNSGIKIVEYGFQYGKTNSMLSYEKFYKGKDFDYPDPINNDVISCEIDNLKANTDYHYEFYAINENGEKTVGSSVYFKTDGDEEKPEVSSIKSSLGDEFEEYSDVTFSAKAYDNRAIKKMYLFIDGEVVLKTSDDSIKYSTDELEAGYYEIAVMAEDTAGNESDVEYLEIEVTDKSFAEDNYQDFDYEEDTYQDYDYDEDASYENTYDIYEPKDTSNNSSYIEIVPVEPEYSEEIIVEENNEYVVENNIEDFHNEAYSNSSYYGGIKVYINGRALYMDVMPEITNGRTMVPLRAIFEALGATVNWNGSTSTVYAYRGNESVELTIGNRYLYTSRGSTYLDSPAYISGGRTLVPVRAVSEAFNCDVKWFGDKQLVSIAANDVDYQNVNSSNGSVQYDNSDVYSILTSMMNGYSYNGDYTLNTKYTGEFANEECKGFAKSIFKKLFGYNIGSTCAKPDNYKISIDKSRTSVVGSVNSLTSYSAKNLFSNARSGDFVQMRRDHSGSHSAIVYDVSAYDVTFYEANTDGKNGIVLKTYTWDELCESNVAMSVYTANNY